MTEMAETFFGNSDINLYSSLKSEFYFLYLGPSWGVVILFLRGGTIVGQ